MSTMTELALRAKAAGHDVSAPTSAQVTIGAPLTGAEVAERQASRKLYEVLLGGETAGTDYTLVCVGLPASQFPGGAKVIAIEFRSSAAVTESATVYNTYTFNAVDKDGVNPVTAATMTTNTVANAGIGTTVAFKKYAATNSATAANLVIPQGGSLTCVRTHASTGTAVPYGSMFSILLEAL